MSNITLPNSLKSIGAWAFYKCSNLYSVTLPSNVEYVEMNAFNECVNITAINVESNNPYYASEDGVLFSKNKTVLRMFPAGKYGNYSIRDGVTIIDSCAFSSCSGLYGIIIPNSVEIIHAQAFYKCNNLSSIVFLSANTQKIGQEAFYGCSKIKKLYCYALTPPEVYNFSWSVDPHTGIESTCSLYVPIASISQYRTTSPWKDFTSIIGIETTESPRQVKYYDKEDNILYDESIALHLPEPPTFSGFTFLKWVVVAGDLEDGIIIQATYTYNGTPTSAPEVYTNPANPAQKLIREGNVYILKGDKTYTLQGQEVR